MSDEVLEGKLFGSFEKLKEFNDVQQACLAFDLFGVPTEEDNQREALLFRTLFHILGEYQEQSYLLDPYLEDLVIPIMTCLRSYAKTTVANRQHGSWQRLERLTELVHNYVKFRGYKTIIRFFPHEIGDLSIALEFLLLPGGPIHYVQLWSLRYTILLWLSLICMIPFDLAQFDDAGHEGRTATMVESVAKSFLGKSGLEREGAALLLSRFYIRRDTSSCFDPFIDWSIIQIGGNADIFMTIGLLQTLCHVVKTGPIELIRPKASQFLVVGNAVDGNETLLNNATVRRLKTKLVSRIALRLLPPVTDSTRRRGRSLTDLNAEHPVAAQEDDLENPAEVEDVLEQLFNALTDKDTIVRWSAAKGMARISERLPGDLAVQVLDTLFGLFSIHSTAETALSDLPEVAEGTWHGACLACAEMARRGVIAPDRLSEFIEWSSKALYFDIRKGAHSIGSNVRDAAAYALWALARTQDPPILAPHTMKLAQRLTTVALYDREIHIRRAASAAFQEHVGRNGLFPHGIDVLGKTDFYAVSVRRNAFLSAAPQVAQHIDYRDSLFDHVLDVVIRHWDPAMRELGSQSLRLICSTDPLTLAPQASAKAMRLLDCVDLTDFHGGLLALSELSLACKDSKVKDPLLDGCISDNFRALGRIPLDIITGPRNAIVTAAACRLISISITLPETCHDRTSVPHWRKVIDYGLKHRNPLVQEAAASAMGSRYLCLRLYSYYGTLIREMESNSFVVQQSLGTFLASIDYSAHPNALSEALSCLLNFVKPSVPQKPNVEARRNCYSALPKILSTLKDTLTHDVSAENLNSIYDTLIAGFDDYSTDARGDVGSWIRIACINGLTDVIQILFYKANLVPDLESYFTPLKFHAGVAQILKQGVERLDNVRQVAGECFLKILGFPLPDVSNAESWRLPGLPLLEELFKGENTRSWSDGSWLFPKAVRLLEIPQYREPILSGFILSLGSKTESTQRPLSTSLVSYFNSLPITIRGVGYDADAIVSDLISRIQSHVASNTVVIPILQTFNVLLQGGVLCDVASNSRGHDSLEKLLKIATTNVVRLKSVPRIRESMKIVVNLMTLEPLYTQCVMGLPDFLGHPFPGVRRDTAEYLYVVLQGLETERDLDEVEDLLLETEWSSDDANSWKIAADRVVALLGH